MKNSIICSVILLGCFVAFGGARSTKAFLQAQSLKSDWYKNERYCFSQSKFLSETEIERNAMTAWLDSIESDAFKANFPQGVFNIEELAQSYISENPDCCVGTTNLEQEFSGVPPKAAREGLEHLLVIDVRKHNFGVLRGRILKAPFLDNSDGDFLRYSLNACGHVVVMEHSATDEVVYRRLGKNLEYLKPSNNPDTQ